MEKKLTSQQIEFNYNNLIKSTYNNDNESKIETRITKHMELPVEIYTKNVYMQSPAEVNVRPHWHSYYEILYILAGELYIMMGGNYICASPGHIIIIPPDKIHGTAGDVSTHIKYHVIKFAPQIMRSVTVNKNNNDYVNMFLSQIYHDVFHIETNNDSYATLSSVIMLLVDEYKNKEDGYGLCISGLLQTMIGLFARCGVIPKIQISKKTDDDIRFDELLEYIDENIESQISRTDAAGFMRMSVSHFSRFFKEMTDMTFKEYIDFKKINEVEKLILTNNLSVKSAAMKVGYTNIPSFCRLFKRIKNYTPSSLKIK